MRPMTLAVIFAFSGSALAADKDEDKAKEVAAAFLKAIRDKDLGAVADYTAVPFAYVMSGKPGIHKETAAFKKWFKGRLDVINEKDVPDGVLGVIPFAMMKSKIKDEKQRAAFAEVMKDQGFVVMLGSKEKGEQGAILVKIGKDGKAKVVGTAN